MRNIRLIIIFISIFLGSLVVAQTTIILQPGTEEGKDACVFTLLPDSALGNFLYFAAIDWTFFGTPGTYRSLIDFDLSEIPENATILDARLSLYYHHRYVDPEQTHWSLSGSNKSYLQRIITPWEEHKVTWNTQPLVDTTHQVEMPQSISSRQDYLDIDVTQLVQDMMDNPGTSFGFRFILQTEEYYRRMCFASSDRGVDSLNPRLEITYSACGIDLGNDTILCNSEELQLSPGSGYSNYLWQDGSTDSLYFANSTGLYWVEITDSTGCVARDSILVTISNPIEIQLGNDTSFCFGQSYLLDAGEGFSAYLWNDGSQTRFNEISSHGFHWVQVSDSLGCTATDSVFVEVYNAFEISLSNDTTRICEGEYLFLNGPDGFESYLWQDGSDYPSLLADTAGTYWLEVTDENGCAARDSVELIVNIIPENLLGNDTVICPEGEITIQATPGYSNYVWHDGSQNQSFTTNHEGIFWLTVQDDIGCAGTDTIKITDFEIPGLEMAEQEWLCPDDTLLLDAGGGYLSYLWSDGSQNQTLQVFNAGNYAVEIETVCGLFSDTVEIKLYRGNLDLGNDTILCDGEVLYLNPGNNYSNFHWSNGSSDSTLFVKNRGTYWLKAFDGFCNVSDSITIDACAEIWIPNVFTPNSDGHNETFYAVTENDAGIVNFKMVIFNRWGRIVHTLENINDAWDGKINGSTTSDGVYFWECNYSARDKTGKINFHSKQGSVTLMR